MEMSQPTTEREPVVPVRPGGRTRTEVDKPGAIAAAVQARQSGIVSGDQPEIPLIQSKIDGAGRPRGLVDIEAIGRCLQHQLVTRVEIDAPNTMRHRFAPPRRDGVNTTELAGSEPKAPVGRRALW